MGHAAGVHRGTHDGGGLVGGGPGHGGTSACTVTVAGVEIVPGRTRSACQARLGQTGPVRDVEIPGRPSMEAAWKAVRRYLAVTPVVAAPQLGPAVSVEGRDGPADRLVQGPRRPGRRGGHP